MSGVPPLGVAASSPSMVDLERIVPLAPGGAATPLFCVHAGSGSAYVYLALARLLGGERPVYGIEAPGFDGVRDPVGSVAALGAEYAETLLEFHDGGDFLLLGWSFGGMIALDLAARLTAAGARVPRVVLVDVGLPGRGDPPSDQEMTRHFLRDFLIAVGSSPAGLEPLLADLPAEAAGQAAFEAVAAAGALPPELDVELLTERYTVFRTHLEAAYGFDVPEPYQGPVTHLLASRSGPPSPGWRELAPALTEHVLPGDHYSIWTGDSLPRLAHLIRAALDGTGAESQSQSPTAAH